MNEILTYEEAAEIFREICSHTDKSDPDIARIYEDLYQRAVKYAHIRAQWNALTKEEKMNRDSSRTSIHDAFIASVDIVARIQKEHGSKWRKRLGEDRKRIGDFACFLALFLGIEAR